MTLQRSFSIDHEKYDDDGRIKRTGTWVSASAHIVTAVIGSGVLSLAWSIAQLGWIAGPIVLIIFSLVTLFTSILLTDCYRHPDPIHGLRNTTYMKMVKNILGGIQYKFCGLVQIANLIGVTIGYTITSAYSMMAVVKSNCFHKYGHEADCKTLMYPFMIIFGVTQILLSQIPNFQDLSGLSVIAAIMSFGYSSIGIGLSIARIAGGENHDKTTLTGTVVGVDVGSMEKLWNVFQALGNIAFAYAFSMVIVEIQDTLKSSPPENKAMKKASTVGVIITTFFYALCGILGYEAFGNKAPGNFLTGFGFYEPYWLVDIGNIFIIIHLVGAYQVFAQPLFSMVEKRWNNDWGECHVGRFRMNTFRVTWRTVYVIFTTVVAVIFPFFNSVVGLIGALTFWPLTVYFPVEMYLKRSQLPKFSTMWIGLKLLSAFCFIVTLVAIVGSVVGIFDSLKTYSPFSAS